MKILLKAAVLLFIVLSIYFIVNPSACTNLMLGRIPQDQTETINGGYEHPLSEHRDNIQSGQGNTAVQEQSVEEEMTQDYRDGLQENSVQPTFTQQDIDWAVASRYVELEQEYISRGAVGKDMARDISLVVMNDFEMTSQEWDSFLERATQENLFNRVRAAAANTEETK